ncbi:MAG: alpha/beta hydrolase fold domain-containing protein [Actinomycetota bacterium]|nr:alpha/beta hydrolase fold domain-containing protein [Actinomycetota bacterium]
MTPPHLPGRLGNDELTLASDPRADPRMVAAMLPIGLADRTPPQPVTVDTPLESLHEFNTMAEMMFDTAFSSFSASLPPVEGVERSIEVIRGIDGNDITLYLHRPAGAHGPLPGLLHLHGGGMTILEASSASYNRWRDHLAAQGLVVCGVEFRNASGKLGPYPYPAGLNDCTSALRWFGEQRERLGVTGIVVSGESGGGNLTLATTLKAKRDGHLDLIAGVYAQCPYISNAYESPVPELTSLFENDGYFLSCEQMGVMAMLYDPTRASATDPLAWPYHASVDDLAGLPPHVISVNELDPLRDEGLAYYRKLAGAGVSAVSRTVNGTCHAGDCIFEAAMPDVFQATIRDIAGFAVSVTR